MMEVLVTQDYSEWLVEITSPISKRRRTRRGTFSQVFEAIAESVREVEPDALIIRLPAGRDLVALAARLEREEDQD